MDWEYEITGKEFILFIIVFISVFIVESMAFILILLVMLKII